MALGKPSWQTSIYESYTADGFVDGDRTTHMGKQCIHTALDYPVWAVDLGRVVVVYFVEVVTGDVSRTYYSETCL